MKTVLLVQINGECEYCQTPGTETLFFTSAQLSLDLLSTPQWESQLICEAASFFSIPEQLWRGAERCQVSAHGPYPAAQHREGLSP